MINYYSSSSDFSIKDQAKIEDPSKKIFNLKPVIYVHLSKRGSDVYKYNIEVLLPFCSKKKTEKNCLLSDLL